MQARQNVLDETLILLSRGPNRLCGIRRAYFVNGYKFHTVERGANRSSDNSGVWVKGTNYADNTFDYYGRLQEVIELEYSGGYTTILFKCEWFDPTPNSGTRVHRSLKLVDVHKNRRYRKYEPFILAMQAHQVYFLPYPSLRRQRHEWLAVCKLQPKFVDEGNIITNTEQVDTTDMAFQDDEPNQCLVDEDLDVATGLADPSGSLMSDTEEDNSEDEENSEESLSSNEC